MTTSDQSPTPINHTHHKQRIRPDFPAKSLSGPILRVRLSRLIVRQRLSA